MDANLLLAWFGTGSNAAIAVMIPLVLWIAYEYVIDFVLRLPRAALILTITYFVLKTLGAPL